MHMTPSNHMTRLSIFLKEYDTVKSFDLSLDISPLKGWHDEANHCVIVSSHGTDVKNS